MGRESRHCQLLCKEQPTLREVTPSRTHAIAHCRCNHNIMAHAMQLSRFLHRYTRRNRFTLRYV